MPCHDSVVNLISKVAHGVNSAYLVRPFRRLCMETEHIGNMTLGQMGRQREQLEGASRNISATMAVAMQARAGLNDM